ncbi:hypothetical protein [Brevibacillus centrosporus]|uniref:hypothetical protein n=1 Tax=Brevibacillus centrosporus TaxID=54910 RepID=UPI003B023A4A
MKQMMIVLVLSLLLAACSSKEVVVHDYQFTGESEHWRAVYHVKGTGTFTEKDHRTHYESESQTNFTLEYKGTLEGLSSVKSLKYQFESSAGGGESTQTFDRPPTTTSFHSSSSAKNGAIETQDETIRVTVEWDGKKESFELTNKKEASKGD